MKCTIKDFAYLTRLRSWELQRALLPKPTTVGQNTKEYISELRTQISGAEEFIYQAKRYIKKASRK